MAVDRTLVACLLKINGFEELSPYKKHLTELAGHYLDLLATVKDIEVLRQYQGRVQQLNDLLEELEQAPALASKIGGA